MARVEVVPWSMAIRRVGMARPSYVTAVAQTSASAQPGHPAEIVGKGIEYAVGALGVDVAGIEKEDFVAEIGPADLGIAEQSHRVDDPDIVVAAAGGFHHADDVRDVVLGLSARRIAAVAADLVAVA